MAVKPVADVVFSHSMATTAHTTDKTRNWELTIPRKQHFTSDEVIDAYVKGREAGKADGLKAGMDAQRNLLLKALQENMTLASLDTKKVLAACKSHRVPVEKALMRIDSWHRFSVMVVVDEKTFASAKLLKVYDVVNSLESSSRTEQYAIRFSFVAGGRDLDQKALQADGYVLRLKTEAKA